jgi:hypothetical protein
VGLKLDRRLACALLCALLCALGARPGATGPRFEVTIAPALGATVSAGRLFVILGRQSQPEPRLRAGETGLDAAPIFARDVEQISASVPGLIDARAIGFPVSSLKDVAPGEYYAQAVLAANVDLSGLGAPGNLYGRPQLIRFDPRASGTIKLQLEAQLPPDALPSETSEVKFVRLRSKLLSEFWGRPIYLRAGVILPRDYAREPDRRYPLRVHIGGYGSRYTNVLRMMDEGSSLRRAWLAADAPRMLLLHLDGAGPYGDPYQINSANNGPYGDAVTRELIPHIEERFRGRGTPESRVLDGGSTGGWVSLALQIFYPDFFNGAWSSCPDGVDFRGFQLVNIYEDRNAYLNEHGFERPGARDVDGDVRYTMRHECQLENVLGRGDRWTHSGGQWGAWNAVYSPRGADSRPVPLWDPQTGAIDHAVAAQWRKYDLRIQLESNWPALAPRLAGKLRIWIGEADNYFLNNAVHLFEASLGRLAPPFDGRIHYGPGRGHCWSGLSESEIMREMMMAIEKRRP